MLSVSLNKTFPFLKMFVSEVINCCNKSGIDSLGFSEADLNPSDVATNPRRGGGGGRGRQGAPALPHASKTVVLVFFIGTVLYLQNDDQLQCI